MRPLFLLAILSFFTAQYSHPAFCAAYDPLVIPADKIEHQDFTVKDEKRSREIPIRVYFPQKVIVRDQNDRAPIELPAPLILFSHGLGGARTNSPYLGEQWAARGYVAVFMQHIGSDESVWRDKPAVERMIDLKGAASVENFLLRVKDVPTVLDQLELWNKDEQHALFGRIDFKHVGMTGHSFGAVTTQAVSGQSFKLGGGYTDPRIKCAIMMSPSTPKLGDPRDAFVAVKIPWLLMTGTKDSSPIGNGDAKSRLLVYPALPPGGKYELVLNNAEHSAFSDRELPGDKEQRNPNHHRAVLALSTAFWDAYLKEDAAAKAWLDGEDVRGVLEKEDTWQKK